MTWRDLPHPTKVYFYMQYFNFQVQVQWSINWLNEEEQNTHTPPRIERLAVAELESSLKISWSFVVGSNNGCWRPLLLICLSSLYIVPSYHRLSRTFELFHFFFSYQFLSFFVILVQNFAVFFSTEKLFPKSKSINPDTLVD